MCLYGLASDCERNGWIIALGHVSLPLLVMGLTLGLAWLFRRDPSPRLALFAFFAGVVLSLMCGLVVVDLFGALDRGKQKGTMADIREIGKTLHEISEREGGFPSLVSVEALNERYGLHLPTTDGWRGALDLRSDSSGYTIISRGSCVEPDPLPWPGGPTIEFTADIVFRNGEFLQWPEGQQR